MMKMKTKLKRRSSMKEIIMTADEAKALREEMVDQQDTDGYEFRMFNGIQYIYYSNGFESNFSLIPLEDELNIVIDTPEDTKITIKMEK